MNDNDKVISFGDTKSKKEVEAALPIAREFLFALTDGKAFKMTGFLIATPSFVGIGTIDGTVMSVVPFENLLFVRATEAIDAPLNAA